jgi:hypothetical protein
MHAHLSKRGPETLKLQLAITFSFVVRFEYMMRHFDRVDLKTHLNYFGVNRTSREKSGRNPRNARISVPKRPESKLSASRVIVIVLT